jgi:SAM-dependent methyltransferase
MQAYGPAFARIYNQEWTHFALGMAPQIRAFYESTPIGQSNRSLLDVCCGTGHLALHFLDHGYRVTGIDLSAAMLDYAKENTVSYIDSGQARYVHADAAAFTLDEQFGLVTSTFDALNHLPSKEALHGCMESVYPLLLPGGFFLFDLNTRTGLDRWNGINVRDTPDLLIIDRGIYDGEGDRAWVKITGFARVESGLFERFEEVAYNTAYEMAWVRDELFRTGWQSVYFARGNDLGLPIADPEAESRVFVVAQK